MMQSARMPDLLPILPEVVLAIGAMLLLLAGAFGATQCVGRIDCAAIVLLGGNRGYRRVAPWR